jgi:homoserine dehydrogenase
MSKNFRIALAGLGTVGGGVLHVLARNRELIEARAGCAIEVVAVSARDRAKAEALPLGNAEWVEGTASLATRADVDCVVELIGGAEGVAHELARTALQQGKHLVTANKALIARHGKALAEQAVDHRAQLAFEAAVAGGIPVLHALRTGLAGNDMLRVAGILNGTCNYILTAMQKEGREFDDVLAEAQAKGYAEADPSFDIDGIDAAHKLAILAALAYGMSPQMDTVHVEGIRHITQSDIRYACELGYRIRLLGIATQHKDGIAQRVVPCLVPADSPLGLTEGVFNAVQIEGDAVGRVLLQGRGAGAGPTASSVISDIIAIARGERWPAFTVANAALQQRAILPMNAHHCCFYLRLTVADEPGVLADVTRIFADEAISVRSIIQHTHDASTPAQVVVVTHETHEAAMQRALAKLDGLTRITQKPMMLRMETV